MRQTPALALLACLPLAAATLPGLPRWADAAGPPGFQARCRAGGALAMACRGMAANIAMLLRQDAMPVTADWVASEPLCPAATPAETRTW
jgi:hypothetical protein